MPEAFRGIEMLPASRLPGQLFVLLHGAGSSDIALLAEKLRAAYPEAAILIPDGAFPLTPAAVHELVRGAQDRLNVLPTDTAIAGFSQGAVVALEYSKAHDGFAGRVLAFSGRYATLPDEAPELATIHLFHGRDDEVMPVEHAWQAYQRLAELRGDVTIDIASNVGHELHASLVDRAINRLQTCIPLRSWQRALS